MKTKFNLVIVIAFLLLSCKKEQFVQTSSDQSSIGITSKEVDSSYVKDILPYKEKLDAEMNAVIGVFKKELVNADYQSTLGNFVMDAVHKKSEELYNQKIDFGLVTKGGLRTPIPKGNVTTGNIFELMPFENELVVLKLKGTTVQKIFNHAAERANVQMSNVQFEIKDKKPQNILIDNQPLDLQKIYSLVLSDYLAGGGDKLTFMTEAEEYIKIGGMFRDVIIEHIKEEASAGRELDANLDNRVNIIE